VLVQQLQHLILAGTLIDRNQFVLARHDVAHRIVEVAFEAHVAAGDDTDQFTVVDHRHAGDIVPTGQVEDLSDAGIRIHGDRILDHPGLVLLDDTYLMGLLLDGHVLVDDAHPASLGHGNGQAGLGDGIHGGGGQGNVELQIARDARRQIDVFRQHLGIVRHQRNVVKSEGFVDQTHGADSSR